MLSLSSLRTRLMTHPLYVAGIFTKMPFRVAHNLLEPAAGRNAEGTSVSCGPSSKCVTSLHTLCQVWYIFGVSSAHLQLLVSNLRARARGVCWLLEPCDTKSITCVSRC